MKERRVWLLVAMGLLLVVSFGMGLFLVSPVRRDFWQSMPLVGTYLVPKYEQEEQEEFLNSPEVLTETFTHLGMTKGLSESGALRYVVKGRLMDDVIVRNGDGMLQGKVVIDGYLQSQPLEFLAGSLDGKLLFGLGQGGSG